MATIDITRTNVRTLHSRIDGRGRDPRRPGLGRGARRVQRPRRPAPGGDRRPGRRARRGRGDRFAREHGLRVAPQGPAHNAGPLASLEDTVLLRTTPCRARRSTGSARVARVRAGARWSDVVPRASELGLSALHGSSATVGIVGYSLGGGMGWQARKHGLQTNHVTAIELVTADGELVRADHDTSPTCSGRCAAAAATSASSPRWSSRSSRSRRSTRARCSGRPSRRVRSSTPGTSCCRGCPTRSPRSAGSSTCRRSRKCPSSCAGARSSSSRRRSSATRPTGARCSRRCGTWPPRSTRSRWSRPPR